MIKEITDPLAWNQFLLNLQPNTFLQSWEWGQVQKSDEEQVQYLGIFNDSDQQIGACLLLTINARRGRHFLIPHGPLFQSEAETRKYLPEIVQYIKSTPGMAPAGRSLGEGWKRGSSPVALRVSPLLLKSPENLQAFQNLGFRPAPMHVHAELTWVLDINKSEEELLSGMRKTTRHAIQKAGEAGVTVEITQGSAAVDRFYALYEQTKDRHDFVPYSKANIARQLELMNLYTVFARWQNQDVAAGIFFQFGQTVFYYHGASIKTSSKISPGQLLQWESIKEARRHGVTLYNFWGIAPTLRSGIVKRVHPFAGITIFKKGFGGRAIPYMHAQDLPLSLGYWKLWATDTYRKIRRGF